MKTNAVQPRKRIPPKTAEVGLSYARIDAGTTLICAGAGPSLSSNPAIVLLVELLATAAAQEVIAAESGLAAAREHLPQNTHPQTPEGQS